MLPIEDLQPHLLLKVFTKMGSISLCRMRRTCKHMDIFVEEHRKKLASRAIKDVDISISPDWFKIDFDYLYEDLVISSNRRWRCTPINQFDFGKQLSGISINHLKLEHLCKPDEVATLLNDLKHLPVIEKVSMNYVRSEVGRQISELIKVRKTFNFSCCNRLEHPNTVINNLNKSLKQSLFCVNNLSPYSFPEEGLFDRLKYFLECEFACFDDFEVFTFLKEMLYSKDLGSTRKIQFSFYDENWSTNYTIDGVNLISIWDQQLSPKQRNWIETQVSEIPLSVRYAQVNNKYAVLIEYIQTRNRYIFIVLFVEEVADIWNCVFKAMKIDSSLEKEFLETEEEEKQKKMRDLLNEQIGSSEKDK